jgi:hypothetical protein
VAFQTNTSSDFDGVNLSFAAGALPDNIVVAGRLGGYVKVGNALKGNPHKAQPIFELETGWAEALAPDGKKLEIKGSAELFVRVEVVPNVQLPKRVEGSLDIELERGTGGCDVYFVRREWDGGKGMFIVPFDVAQFSKNSGKCLARAGGSRLQV